MQDYRSKHGTLEAKLAQAREVVLSTVRLIDSVVAKRDAGVSALAASIDTEVTEILSYLEADDSASSDRGDSPCLEVLKAAADTSFGKDLAMTTKKRQLERVKLDKTREERAQAIKKLRRCREVLVAATTGNVPQN